MNNIERELKTLLTEREHERLFNLGGRDAQLQTNYYFYAEGMPADIMLRIRVRLGEYLFCYKRLLSSENGINVCDERETKLSKAYAEQLLYGSLTRSDLLKLVNVDLPCEFKRAGSLNTYRSKFPLGKWTIELDKNEYLGRVDYELECECDSDESLQELKTVLASDYGIVFKPSLSKSARFFAELFSRRTR